MTIDPNNIPQPKLHGYLVSAIAPRPIAFVSSIDEEGNVNLSPFSFFNIFSSNPPIVVFSPVRKGTDQTNKDTYHNIKLVPEVVISIVTYPIVEQMSLASAAYPKGVNEFEKAGFTEVASEKVKPPRVGESPVSMECVVEDVIELGEGGGAGNLIIAKVVFMHIDDAYLDEKGRLDTTRLDLVGRMGGIWYTRAGKESLFEIPRPLKTPSLGIDQLPPHIHNSHILTGNNLGRLGNVQQLPPKEDIDRVRNDVGIIGILQADADSRKELLHRLAQNYLEEGKTHQALCILMLEEAK